MWHPSVTLPRHPPLSFNHFPLFSYHHITSPPLCLFTFPFSSSSPAGFSSSPPPLPLLVARPRRVLLTRPPQPPVHIRPLSFSPRSHSQPPSFTCSSSGQLPPPPHSSRQIPPSMTGIRPRVLRPPFPNANKTA